MSRGRQQTPICAEQPQGTERKERTKENADEDANGPKTKTPGEGGGGQSRWQARRHHAAKGGQNTASGGVGLGRRGGAAAGGATQQSGVRSRADT